MPVAGSHCAAGIIERKKNNYALQEAMWQCEKSKDDVLKINQKAVQGC